MLQHITEEQKALFEMHLEEIRLKAANSFLLKTATTSVVIEDQELPIIEEKINKVKTDIVRMWNNALVCQLMINF